MPMSYLFVYDGGVGTQVTVREVFDRMQKVATWRYDLPNCFYIISDSSAQELYEEFVSINGTKGRFMFIEASTNRQGQMLPDTWYLLTNKRHKPKDG